MFSFSRQLCHLHCRSRPCGSDAHWLLLVDDGRRVFSAALRDDLGDDREAAVEGAQVKVGEDGRDRVVL